MNLVSSKTYFLALLVFGSVVSESPCQTFTTVLTFQRGISETPLIQGTDGNLYGTLYNPGQVFRITPAGTLTILHWFGGPDGDWPNGALVQGADGNYYGTTSAGGTFDSGTVFRINSAGKLSTLSDFNYAVSGQPIGAMVQGLDGNFYGTAEGGPDESGNAFRVTPTGALTVLTDYSGTPVYNPVGLVLATNGDFYGVSSGLFKMTPQGVITGLDYFTNADGSDLNTPIQAMDGNFYGTTGEGGAYGSGTVFKVTPSGVVTVLHNFNGLDASYPNGLIQGSDGNFYGTSYYGGGYGTIFKITPQGELTVLYSFNPDEGGIYPLVPLVQDTNGLFYGITNESAPNAQGGSIFSLSVGLAPFVKTLPAAAPTGTTISILGTDLTGATSVTFNGIPAAFTVASPSLITAIIPAGATSGNIEVTTPGATLLSNAPFRVLPVIRSFSPSSGAVGTGVIIAGNSFTGTTSVSFGSVNASDFTVNSDTRITATVPAGASTGRIYVTTPGGPAASASSFTVN